MCVYVCLYVCMYVCTYVWSGEASAVKRAPPVPIDPDELPAREKFRLMQARSPVLGVVGGHRGKGLGLKVYLRVKVRGPMHDRLGGVLFLVKRGPKSTV